jgi:UDP-galactopyranose mutase
MKILIIGSGLSGISIARLLKDKGHDVSLIEKKNRIGGLCITDINEDGLMYEPFGARTFHSNNQKVISFVKRFDNFNGYTHRKGMILNGKLFPFPITKETINDFEDKDKIFEELKNRPKQVDNTNFETACISIFGKTLYNYFIRNYTEKMWGIDPKELTAEWAPKRLELREDDKEGLFKNQWQGLPKKGYSAWLEKMIEGIDVKLNTTEFTADDYDVVVSTKPIDEIWSYWFGKLQYRSLKFDYKKDELWENDNYGTINLPQHKKYIRKCNFKVLHKQESEHNLIQYQESIESSDIHVPMYPVSTKDNELLFNRYLKGTCKMKNMCPLGRLGLFKYLDMDKAIEVSMGMVDIIENYLYLDSEQRYRLIQKIRECY